MTTWESIEGASSPLGVSYIEAEDAYNFALYSKHGESVTLLLFSRSDLEVPDRQIHLDPLRNRSGRIWHCRIPSSELANIRFYAYCVDGPEHRWNAFDRDKQLLDPYATEIHIPDDFDRAAAIGAGSNAGRAMLGCIKSTRPSQDLRPAARRHGADLVIYELHVRGFTQHPSSNISPARRGTFAGVVDRIPYLLELGVTAVELMPVFQHDPGAGDYWGYSPVGFFAPHSGYSSCGDVIAEFRSMVDALHAADIEVILDVVFNHTAEGDHLGPTYSFKGIDNSTYYLCGTDAGSPYLNYSGVGNTLHTANQHVRRVILDSLRYWSRDQGVDGFRFDLASIFSRDLRGDISRSDSATPIFGDFASDPRLSTTRLIAEPWDAAGAYQLGRSFPGTAWYQWNARFRDDVRCFVRGDSGMVGAIMTRLYGSDDLFPDRLPEVFHPYQGVNFVTSHDGFTLNDLVSYERAHNEANGHENTDGPRDNFSSNYGYEGALGASAKLVRLRLRQAKNMFAILMLSNGTPMIRAGDEFLQSQLGNSNPYNQDNETSWLDWSLREKNREMFRFVREMIAFRKRHPSLCRSRYWRSDVHWYGAGGSVDLSDGSRQLAMVVEGRSQEDVDIYALFNMAVDEQLFDIQVDDPTSWSVVIDSAKPGPHDIVAESGAPRLRRAEYLAAGRSVVVLVRATEGPD